MHARENTEPFYITKLLFARNIQIKRKPMGEEKRDLLRNYLYQLFPLLGVFLRIVLLPPVRADNFWIQPITTGVGLAIWIIKDRKPSSLASYALISFLSGGYRYQMFPNPVGD